MKGPLITACIACLALGAVIAAFSANASPYVTIAQARVASGNRLHLAGDLVKTSVQMNVAKHVLEFDLKDQTGLIHVIHVGEPPANIKEVNKVVAIGGMKGGNFVSTQLLVKCPSKYEADGSGATSSSYAK